MSADSTRVRLIALALVAPLFGACFHSTAPPGWLTSADVAQREAYGGWITVQYEGSGAMTIAHGELIAASSDTLHVLTLEKIVAIPVKAVHQATLARYQQGGGLGMWGTVGGLATISHGFVLIATAPIWILASTTAAASASKAPRVMSIDPVQLARHARFPQGLPPGLNPSTLKQKPVRPQG